MAQDQKDLLILDKRIQELEKENRDLKYKIKQIPGLLAGNTYSAREIRRELEEIGLKA